MLKSLLRIMLKFNNQHFSSAFLYSKFIPCNQMISQTVFLLQKHIIHFIKKKLLIECFTTYRTELWHVKITVQLTVQLYYESPLILFSSYLFICTHTVHIYTGEKYSGDSLFPLAYNLPVPPPNPLISLETPASPPLFSFCSCCQQNN